MSLRPRTSLGHYEILALLGAGGMGEVYRARDTRLGRDVALKILPDAFVSNPDRLARFDREARTLASLNHTNIAQVYGFEEIGTVRVLVLECVDGEDLAARLARGALPLDEALPAARQIAEAIEAAHEAGIVHRDLKPANIKVRSDGRVKVLDFGLAKAMDASYAPTQDPALSPTLTSPAMTMRGAILGTAAYMAPEQARGKPVDKRADIWAFGVVLFEMLTGTRAFAGANVSEVLAAVLRDTPALDLLPVDTPPAVRRLLTRCLERDPSRRLRDIGEARIALDERDTGALPAPTPVTAAGAHVVHVPAKSVRHVWFGLVTAMLVVAAVAGIGWRAWVRSPSSTLPRPERAVQRSLTRLTFDPGLQTDPAFSPDGRFIAYASDKAGNFDIWVQLVTGGDPVQITRAPAQDTQPAWSPDGSTIVFHSDRHEGGLYVVPALGGAERLLARFGAYPSWSPDGSEVRFLSGSALEVLDGSPEGFYTVSVKGDPPRQLLPEFTRSGNWIWIGAHPDGRTSFVGRRFEGESQSIGFYTVSAEGQVTVSNVVAGGELLTRSNNRQRFQWNAGGTALFLESFAGNVRSLWRVQVEPTTLAWISAERLTAGAGADVAAAVSRDGTRLVFSSEQGTERLWSFPFDQAAQRVGVGRPVSEPGAAAGQPRLGPDGHTVVYPLSRGGVGIGAGWINNGGLWLTDLDTGRSQLLSDNAEAPVWSRDGRSIAFTKLRQDITDGTATYPTNALAVRTLAGSEELISPWSTSTLMLASDWAPDGLALLVSLMDADSVDLALWPMSGRVKRPRTVVAAPRTGLWGATYSPNQRWLSFIASRETGAGILVTRAEGAPPEAWIRIAPDKAWVDKPRWAPDGRRLYFLAKTGSFLNLWSVKFDPQQGTPVGSPFKLTNFESPALTISRRVDFAGFDISDRRVVMTMRTASGNIWMIDNVDR